MPLQIEPPDSLELRFWHGLTVVVLVAMMVIPPIAIVYGLATGPDKPPEPAHTFDQKGGE